MTEGRGRDDVRRRLEKRYRRLEESRGLAPVAGLVARFTEIDGGTQGALVSTQLFTTVIPLIIIGFSYFSGFADNASPGTIFIRQFALEHPLKDRVREAFGHSSGLRADWSLIGVAGFLVWGIPMSITIAGIFAKAWRRQQFGLLARLLRGTLWFLLYLAMIAIRERISFGSHHGHAGRTLLFIVGLVPVWLFWSLTPVLLVRDGWRGMGNLALAGLAGVVIDGVAIPLGARLFFPSLLHDWDGFGPIGVAMSLLIWCGVVGTGWVVIACVSALLWERTAPSALVVESQTAGID
ncbi:hypothetical protein BayCH28_13780 [Mycolicibacterium sp. CH28]|uniref:hypothetical protein n=1 Tax=Mycolicibacterium sp. CH28 TaxID=2512237 RepID=UPI001080B482|nr:hypothetical protein [Mycolicibacterium sp. CH28]TGD87436.1 hypothetical protein BayCH28_13780 [Mycolicibacterium sp. CH28]